METGWRLGDRVEIVKGLAPGERLVVSGNFLIDSESRMKLAAAGMYGNISKDPVCGMNVDEGKAKAAGRKSEHQGQAYYFCCEKCKEKFDKEPARFLGQAAGSPEQSCYATDPPKAQASPATAKDPVCGMDVDEAQAGNAGRKSDYQGKTYYFCADGCKQQFEKNPESFLAKAAPKPVPSCCAGHAASPEKAAAARPAAVKDLVCGMELKEAALAGGVKREYQGKTYYFCGENCKQQFDQDSQRYVAPMGGVASTPVAAVPPPAPTDGGHRHD